MKMNYRELLAEQDRNHETTEAQREANKFRLQYYEWLNREKTSHAPLESTDVLLERAKDRTYTFTPNSLLGS